MKVLFTSMRYVCRLLSHCRSYALLPEDFVGSFLILDENLDAGYLSPWRELTLLVYSLPIAYYLEYLAHVAVIKSPRSESNQTAIHILVLLDAFLVDSFCTDSSLPQPIFSH